MFNSPKLLRGGKPHGEEDESSPPISPVKQKKPPVNPERGVENNLVPQKTRTDARRLQLKISQKIALVSGSEFLAGSTVPTLKLYHEQIKASFEQLGICQDKRLDAILESSLGDQEMDKAVKEQMDEDSLFNHSVVTCISQLDATISERTEQPQAGASSRPSASASINIKPPKIKINSFADNNTDSFAFYKFQSSFNNAMDSLPDMQNKDKFCYLRSYLSGRAFSMVENLPIADSSYEAALSLLEDEFLDHLFLLNNIFFIFINAKICQTLKENMELVSTLKCKLQELEKLKFPIEDDGKFGVHLASCLIRSKLYPPFLEEVIRKTSCSYPSLFLVCLHANDIFKLLLPKETFSAVVKNVPNFKEKFSKPFHSGEKQLSRDTRAVSRPSADRKQIPAPTMAVQAAPPEPKRGCRFCSRENHSSLHCKLYPGVEDRRARCRALGCCDQCLSPRHTGKDCRGGQGQLGIKCSSCFSRSHVTPLCPQLVLSLNPAKVSKEDSNTR